jgi:hypothetical protein
MLAHKEENKMRCYRATYFTGNMYKDVNDSCTTNTGYYVKIWWLSGQVYAKVIKIDKA